MKGLSREQALAQFQDTDPITLTEASRVVLRGVVSVSALRAEIRRGNLAVEKIGKNLFTTPAAIREMRDKCRVSIRAPSKSDNAAHQAEAQAALKGAIADLKRNSRK